MQKIELWLRRYGRRVRLGLFLKAAAEVGTAALFLFGAAVLVTKLFVPAAWPHVLWLALAAIPAAGLAWWLAQRETWTRAHSAAGLDESLQTGGLLMTLCERPDPHWLKQLPQDDAAWADAIPKLRPKRFASCLVLPLVFAVASCFAPLRKADTAPAVLNTVGQAATKELEDLLKQLDEEKVLPKDEEEQARKEIEKLVEETKKTPLTHEKWETVDALREKMRAKLDAALSQNNLAKEAAQLLAQALNKNASELSSDQIEQLQQDVLETLRKLSENGTLDRPGAEGLKDALQRLIKKNGDKKSSLPSDPDELQDLLDDLDDFLEQEAKRLDEIRKKCKGCAGGQCEGIGNGSNGGSIPGQGGITRGRADAELTFGDESTKDGTKIKDVILPPGTLDQPKDDVLGVTRTAPKVEPGARSQTTGDRTIEATAGHESWNRRLSPKHRNVVQKFFRDPPAKSPK